MSQIPPGSKLPYEKRTLVQLKEECKTRGIKYGGLRKGEICNLLKEDDLKKVAKKPAPISQPAKPIYHLVNPRPKSEVSAFLDMFGIPGKRPPSTPQAFPLPTSPPDLFLPTSPPQAPQVPLESDSEGDFDPVEIIEFEKVPTGIANGKKVFARDYSITLEEFIEELENADFVSAFLESVKKFMTYKHDLYQSKLKEIKAENHRVSLKVKKLQAVGARESTIKEMYPMFHFYEGFIFQLQDIINLVSSKLKGLSAVSLKKGLLRSIRHTKKGLAAIVGRDEEKDQIVSILYSFSKSHKTLINAFTNFCFTGSAGTGKTALAKVIGYVFSKSGILATSVVKIVSRADLVRGYVGHTAPATRSMLFETLEGVLFIDEAYQLTPMLPGQETNDFGKESITELVNFTDKWIGTNVIMLAGYEDKMKKYFFPSNEGLTRRFPYMLHLSDYSEEELANILVRFIKSKTDEEIDEETSNYLYSVLSDLGENYPGAFNGQAGDMLNLGTSIVKSVHAAFRKKWSPGNLKNNKPIILNGVKEFMKLKGYEI